MKYCHPHWDELRQAILDAGLGHLIAANGREALARTVAELKGKATVADFDPLMVAHNMVMERATQYFGLALFTPNEDGSEKCPVCLLLTVPDTQGRDRAALEQHYSGDLADFMYEECKKMGIEQPYPLDPHGLDEP